MFLVGFSSGRIISLTLNFLYLKFNIIFTFLRLVFINNIFIKMLFYISVITRAFLLITPYIIFRSVFWLSYQIFAPYNIVVYTTATWIFRMNPKASPYFLIIPYILTITFFVFSIFWLTWVLSLNLGSNIMPNYFIVLILNLISLLPILSLLFLVNLISKFFFIIMNSIASVFLISKLTIFRTLYLITILLIFYKTFITSFILPPIINPRLLIKNR